MTDDLIPVSDEQAKAIQELAKITGTTVEQVGKAGAYIAWVLGTVPRDLVGVLGGDWLGQVRIRNFARLKDRTEEILWARAVNKTEPVSPSLAVPLLRAAADESREDLQEVWARLLAAAMDPARKNQVRRRFIGVVSEFDPLDARVLELAVSNFSQPISNPAVDYAKRLENIADQVQISFENLQRSGCFVPNAGNQPNPTAFGRLLVMTCRD